MKEKTTEEEDNSSEDAIDLDQFYIEVSDFKEASKRVQPSA